MLNIKCFNQSHPPKDYSFYVLSKGNNAGRPMRQPCPNCFTITFDDYDMREDYYWTCFAIYNSRIFESYLTGSVIPFLRLPDVSGLLEIHYEKMQQNRDKFTTAVERLVSCQERANTIKHNLYLLEIVHKSTLYSIMK